MEGIDVNRKFRYLLVRIGKNLCREDCENIKFVYKLQDPPQYIANVGLFFLSKLEAEGEFDSMNPEKLQEILENIERKDFAPYIREYKQGSAYRRALKLEQEREREEKRQAKKNKKGGINNKGSKKKEEGVGEERVAAAKLLMGVEHAATEEERRWRDLFAMALTQTAQLVEQTEILRKALATNRDQEDSRKERIEEALTSIMTAQDEVKSFSHSLKKAISAAGLKSRRSSKEDHTPCGTPESVRKQPLPMQSPGQHRPRATTMPTATPLWKAATTPTATPPFQTKKTVARSKLPEDVCQELKQSLTMRQAHDNSSQVVATPPSVLSPQSSSSSSSSSIEDEGHIYENPAKSKLEGGPQRVMREEKGRAGTHSSMKESLSKEETGDYVNSSVIVSGSLQSGRTLLSEQTSSSSIVSRQDDSGLGSEDKSWGGELLNLEEEKKKSRHRYVNMPILSDDDDPYTGLLPRTTDTPATSGEYATTTGEYAAIT